ncbi:hypothetical protein BD410DRAFT_319352 [Rickenella mellea]|uniref:Uncharacterized protein n=1 Tax=Rickenella mellea TaxID=50990 RepID=A0A4Y7Q0H4_9AGAM|nr:hypothetical protein BD410DRAFT_319352 [Rickenella mellea]
MKIPTSTSFVVATLAISSSSLAIPVADGPPQSPTPDVSATNSPRSAHTEQISQFAGRSPALRSGSGRRRSLPRRRSSHGSISKRQVPGAADPVTQPVSGGIVAQTLTGLGLNIFGARATPPSPPAGAPQPPTGAPAPPSGAPAPQGAPSPPGGAPAPATPPQGAPATPQGAPSPPGSAPAPAGAPAAPASPPAGAPTAPVKARALPDTPVSIIMPGGQVAQVPLSTLGSLLSGAAVPGPGAEIIQVISANGDAIPFSVAKGPLAAALSATPLNARSVPPTPNGTPDMASLAGSIVDVVTPNGIIPVKLPTDAVTNVGSGPAGQVVQVVGANGELIPIPLSEIVAGAAPAPVKPLAKGAPHVGPRGIPDITGKLPAPAYQIIEILGPDGPVPFKVPTSMLSGAPGAVTGMVGQVPGALPFGAVGGLTSAPGAVTGMVGQMSGSLPFNPLSEVPGAAGGLTGGMVGNTAGTVMGSLPVPMPVNPAQMMPGMFGGLQENPNGAEQPAASSKATVSPAPSDASSCTTCTDSSGPSPTMSSSTDGAPTSTPTGQVAAVVGPRDGLPLPAGMAAPTAPTPGDVPPLVQ